jgi:malate synthase
LISLTADDGREIGNNLWIESLWENQDIFPPELMGIIHKLSNMHSQGRRALLENRRNRQDFYDSGKLPSYLSSHTQAMEPDWRISPIPSDYFCRRVEITGPVNDPKMVINMLCRNKDGHRADTAMLDFEDSMKPNWENVLAGYRNLIGAVDGTLEFIQKDKVYHLDKNDMPGIMVRVRGLQMEEKKVLVRGKPVSAGLLDLVVCAFHISHKLISQGKTPKFYIPKCEHFEEARWWNDLIFSIEEELGIIKGSIKVTFLIETLPAAFQMEEILFEAKEHIIGMNVGRWDKIFSDIKVLRNHPDRISPDRSTINMSKFWMDNYAKRLIKICHYRGALAIGGMSAFTPGKTSQIIEEQTAKVKNDKDYEAKIGHDGCWVSHPYFISTALDSFPNKNQLDQTLDDFPKFPDLLMDGKGPKTMEGLRKNIRVGIAYLEGWLRGIGCVSFDNLMEDLATLEISRVQTWQWLYHQITLDSGEKVTIPLLRKLFAEEFKIICEEMKDSPDRLDSFHQGAMAAEEIFLSTEFREFLTI